MSATISFLAGNGITVNNLSGSGLGFYGSSGFGASVLVGNYQNNTYVTDSTGTIQGPQGNNVQYLNAASGILGTNSSGTLLTQIPNYQATLNVRFTYATQIHVQNAYFTIYDRVSVSNPASGVTTKVAQIIHPDNVQNNNGSGSTSWATPAGTGTTLPLCPSPGISGLYAGNGNNSALWADTQHDWYVAISASPNSIGSKTQYGCYVYLEYL